MLRAATRLIGTSRLARPVPPGIVAASGRDRAQTPERVPEQINRAATASPSATSCTISSLRSLNESRNGAIHARARVARPGSYSSSSTLSRPSLNTSATRRSPCCKHDHHPNQVGEYAGEIVWSGRNFGADHRQVKDGEAGSNASQCSAGRPLAPARVRRPSGSPRLACPTCRPTCGPSQE
jgi:hypothetical protein